MLKLFVCFSFSFFIHCALAQNVSLKKPLGAEDIVFLKKEATECFRLLNNLRASYSSTDLHDYKNVVGDKPATPENIKLLEKQIKEKPDNTGLLIEITGLYSRLNMPDEAETYRQKAITLLNKEIEQRPDSADAYCLLGGVYTGASKFGESIAAYRKSLDVKPTNAAASMMIPLLYIMTGYFDSATVFINQRLNKFPELRANYDVLPIYYFYDLIRKIKEADSKGELSLTKTDSIININALKKYYEKNRADFQAEFLYRVSHQILLSTFIMIKSTSDKAFNPKKVRFNVSKDDKQKLAEAETFFQSCLKRKEVENNYFPNKLLGNIYMLMDDEKKAIPYLKKAIELKPVQKCTITSNVGEDYSNLLSAYIISNDTVSYLKLLEEKIKVKPTIDADPDDYLMMAQVELAKKKYDASKKYYNDVFSIKTRVADSKIVEAYLGLALINFLQDNDKEALVFINKAYAKDKNKWELFILYGIISLKENDIFNAYELLSFGKKLHDKKWIKEELMDRFFEMK